MAHALPNRAKLLLGPGPGNLSPGVRLALTAPERGHLDPEFLEVMERVKTGLRELFRTANPVTFPVSGTGSAGMEFLLRNFLEPGDGVVVAVNGLFGKRIANLATQLGARVTAIESPWGEPFDPATLLDAVARDRPAITAIVTGETSTGVYQPPAQLADAVRAVGGLLLADCVTSIAGMPLAIDDWRVDLAFAGTQKCIGCPPGLAPVTVGPRAMQRFEARRSAVPSFYFSLSEIIAYIGGQGGRSYHHTAPIQLIYALAAALDEAIEEGEQRRCARHADAADRLIRQLGALGLEPLVPAGHRLNPLTTFRIPPGVDEARIRARLLNEHDIEIGGGLGPLAGKVWRVGLMGPNATRANADRLTNALRAVLG